MKNKQTTTNKLQNISNLFVTKSKNGLTNYYFEKKMYSDSLLIVLAFSKFVLRLFYDCIQIVLNLRLNSTGTVRPKYTPSLILKKNSTGAVRSESDLVKCKLDFA